MADIARLKQEKSGVIWIDLRAIEHKVLCRTDEGNGRLDIVEAAGVRAEVLARELEDGGVGPHGRVPSYHVRESGESTSPDATKPSPRPWRCESGIGAAPKEDT